MNDQEKEKKPRQTDYRRFYKKAIDERQGYITKEGDWAAVPLMNSKKFVIINNGEQVHVSRNFDAAKTYILKNKKRNNGSRPR